MRPSILALLLFPGVALAAPHKPLAPASPRVGTIEKLDWYPSAHVARRNVEVWLPPGYAKERAARYPVLYVQDGQNAFDPATAEGQVEWGLDESMARLIEARRVRPAIVVAVWSTFLRTVEYMPQKALLGRPLAGWADKIPGGAQEAPISDFYLRFLVEELKPEIDRRYRTRPGRTDTFVMGSSLGALVSLYALSEYPAVFGGAACLSTHWPAADGATLDYAEKTLPKAGQHRLYFDFETGGLDAEYGPYQERMDAVLRSHGYRAGKDWVTRKLEGAGHDQAAWGARLEAPLRFLLRR